MHIFVLRYIDNEKLHPDKLTFVLELTESYLEKKTVEIRNISRLSNIRKEDVLLPKNDTECHKCSLYLTRYCSLNSIY